jgi:tetratricopeptide (TPR) repeat protein
MKSMRTRILAIAAIPLLMLSGTVASTVWRSIELKEARSETVAAASDLPQRELQIAAWSRALVADPTSAIALAQLGGLHLQRARETGDESDYLKAEEFSRQSLALRVNRNAKSYVTLATALMAEHRFSEAEAIALKAVEYDPGLPQYAALLAEIRLELGDYAGARPLFDSLRRFKSIVSIGPRLSRWAELNGDTPRAFDILRRSVEAADTRSDLPSEQRAWFHYRLADLEMRNGKFYRARREFMRGLEIEPADYRILAGLAKLSLLQGDADLALAYAERALALKLDPANLGIIADAHFMKKDSSAAEEAIVAMEAAVRSQPGAYHRAWSLFLLDHGRRYEEVRTNASTELDTRKDIYGYDILAWSFYRSGMYDSAATNMRRALQLGTRDPILYYHAGMIEKALGHKTEARAFLSAALRINDRFDPLQASVAARTLDALSE